MKKLIGNLMSLLVVVLAVGSAVASTSFAPAPVGTLKYKDANGQWQVVPQGQIYTCQSSASDCTALFDGSSMIAGSLRPGTYTPQPE